MLVVAIAAGWWVDRQDYVDIINEVRDMVTRESLELYKHAKRDLDGVGNP